MYLVPFYTGSQPPLAHTRMLSISGLLITSWPMEEPSLTILNKVIKYSEPQIPDAKLKAKKIQGPLQLSSHQHKKELGVFSPILMGVWLN